MTSAPGFPITLRHPQHAAARLVDANVSDVSVAEAAGSPERFPDVTVHDERQEEMYRARGYLRMGESPVVADAKLEYPKVLIHPEHEEVVPASKDSFVNAQGQTIVFDVPAKPGKFPDKTVYSKKEEDEWAAKGYHPAGHFDEVAYERALWAEGEAGDEYPRWEEDEDGNPILVQDPNLPSDESRLYPMMVYDKEGNELGVAKNAAEVVNLKARGSSKNESVKKAAAIVPHLTEADYAEWQEFQQFKQWKAAQAGGATEMVAEPVMPPDAEPDVEDLRKQATELGIIVDKRWGAKTLQREIDLALGG